MTNGSFRRGDLELAYQTFPAQRDDDRDGGGGDGDAPLIVFLPDVALGGGYFRPLARLLAPRFRCVLLDPRGCGASTAPATAADYSVDAMADDVLALLDHLGARTAALYGHVVGGNVAIEAALRAPARIERLWLASFAASSHLAEPYLARVRASASPALSEVIERHERAGPVIDENGWRSAEYAAAAAEVWTPYALRSAVPVEAADGIAYRGAAYSALWGNESAFRITGSTRDLDQCDRLRALECPVELHVGRYDGLVASSVCIARAQLAKLRVVELTQSAHYPHAEEAHRCAEAMLSPSGATSVVALRTDVARAEVDGTAALEDQHTGYRVGLGETESLIIEHLGRPLPQVVGQLCERLGPDYEQAQVAEALTGFLAELSADGLLAEGLSSEQIEERQRHRRRTARAIERSAEAARTVAEACRRVPFYRDRLRQAGVPLDEVTFEQLPTMSKADVRASFLRLSPDDLDVQRLITDGALTLNATSGTTDERLQVVFDPKAGTLPPDYQSLWDLEEPIDKGAIFTSPICAGFECHLGKATQAERTRGVTLTLNSCDDLMAITDTEVKAIVSEMHGYAPRMLFVNPWYATWFLRRVRALELTLPPVAVVLSSYQFLTLRHRKLLREGFGAKVFSYYGATDLGGALIGTECSQGRMHVREDHVFFEIVHRRKDGLGHIAVTTLASPHMPLVRYLVGDLARETTCTCPRVEWPAFILEGRAKDALLSTGGAIITTREVDAAIGELDLDYWRLHQESVDGYRLTCMPAADWSRERVLQRLGYLLGPGARVTVDIVDAFSPERSLKFRQTSSALPIPW
ncbi:MAG: alpha/beta fold hydrolase [Deltaproteobacteria bacterium]|nr:alpha/beta fold hydrolase [Deltaproteobacteria bacterium]